MPNTDLDITLDGTHYRLRSPLSYTNLATLPPKVVIGDYSADTNELMSSWVLTDLTGGHGVTDLTAADTNRYRWASGIYTRYPGQWSLPYRIWSTNENDGQFQPLGDGLTKVSTKDDFDWRHFSVRGRTIYVDNVDTGRTATAKAVNKGGVFQGNGSAPMVFIPHGPDGYTIYDPVGLSSGNIGNVWKFATPKFVGFALLDDKLIGIDQDGYLYKSVRSNDVLDTGINNSVTTLKVDAPDVKYSVGSLIQIDSEQMTVTAVNKANQTLTVTRASGGTSAASHSANAKIYGVWFKYGGKCRLPAGTAIRDLIVYNDRDGQPTVHIITDRDVWALDDGGPRVFPTALQFPQSPFSGVGSAVWRGDLYVAGGMDIYRYNGDVVSNIGLSRDDGLPRDYAGFVADLAAGPRGLYALVRGKSYPNVGNTAGYDYWSVQEWSGSGWHTIWAEKMNWASTTLNAAITDADATTIYVTSNNKFEYGDIIQVDNEKMFVNRAGASNSLIVRRGRYRTNNTTHSNGATVWSQRLPTFINVSLAEVDRIRVYWGVGHTRFYQEQPSEAVNPREDVENDPQVGFGRATVTAGPTYTYTASTSTLETSRFDAGMPGYAKVANALEVRLRRLPATQIARLYYRVDSAVDSTAAWTLLGTIAGGDQTTLNGGINNSTTSVTLTNVEFIQAGMTLTVDSETMTVTAVNTATKVVTVTRGGSPASHSNGATAYVNFRVGTIQNGRNLFRFGNYTTNNNVFPGVPFHRIQFKVEIKDERGNVKKSSALASQLSSGVVTTAVAEDSDFVDTLATTAGPNLDTFVIEHLSFSFLKLRSPSGSWVADIDLTEPWMDQSPEALADKLETLLSQQKFVAFQHKDKTYRVRLAQVTGADNTSDDERMTRRINILEMPITVGPLGDW